jgi:hypothetical protein
MDQPLNVTIVAKKVDGIWEAAVLSSGKFSRALTGKDLQKIVVSQLTALLSFNRSDDSEVSVQVSITDGPEKTEGEDQSGPTEA